MLISCLFFTIEAEAKQGDLEAERVKYYREQKLVKAFGNVHLKTEKVNLWADQMTIKLDEDKLIATGNVKTKDKTGEFTGEKLEYDLHQENGIFINSKGIIIDDSLQEPMYVESPKTHYGQTETKLASPQFTSCNLESSHYHFQAANMVIHPEDKIIAYHVTFWEFNGTVPLFYTPIWIYSLKDDRNRLQTEFGRSEQKGWFVKNTYNYRLDDQLPTWLLQPLEGKFGQLYLDYFSKLGYAGGFKHYYRTLKSDHAYLYLYLEQDKRNKSQSPWITAELNRQIDKEQVNRSYTLKYKDHTGSYLSTPKEIDWWEFTYDQTLTGDNWKRVWDVTYNKNEDYENDLDLTFDLDRTDWEQDKLGLDVDYSLTEQTDSRTDEYHPKLNYKKYLTEDLYLEYNYDYQYERDSYTDRDTEDSWNYDTDLTLGENKNVYDWKVKTKFDRTKQKIKSYNLPEAELTLHPGQVWDYDLIDPLDITLGGKSRYSYAWYQHSEQPTFKETWQQQKKHGYYKLRYDDQQKLGWGNSLDYDQQWQQDIYSGGYLHWWYDSKLKLTTEFPFNWENNITHNYRKEQGIVPDGFEGKSPEKNVKEVLSWRQGKSNFELKTGYDFLKEKYDDLTGSLNYNFNSHYETKMTSRYDLNKNEFEEFESSLIITYNDFEYTSTAQLDLNTGQPISWDNNLDWKFGRDKWEWHFKGESVYDYELEEFKTAKINLEKELHCRKLVISHDWVNQETWVQYQILAFPQSKANVGHKEGEGMLFGGELGRLVDEED